MAAGALEGGAGAGGRSELTPFQLGVARLFFALPESKGFLLAGGAALLAQHGGIARVLRRLARSTYDRDRRLVLTENEEPGVPSPGRRSLLLPAARHCGSAAAQPSDPSPLTGTNGAYHPVMFYQIRHRGSSAAEYRHF
jgi:hypothetical protein